MTILAALSMHFDNGKKSEYVNEVFVSMKEIDNITTVGHLDGKPLDIPAVYSSMSSYSKRARLFFM